jgi:FAD/FMN-containing dehydrogenase
MRTQTIPTSEVRILPVTKKLLDQMRAIVGADNAFDDAARLKEYSDQLSLFNTKSPSAVVLPGSSDEVHQLVKLANERSIPLIPVSSGKPKLRGDSAPKIDGAVAVDLRRLDKILRVDKKNKVVMVEPGVTYPRLLDELKQHGLRPLMSFLPKSSKSVVANCLDREPITAPRFHWDSSDPLLCTEVVFGSGDLFRTGAAAGPGSLEEQWASGQAQKNPMGPSQFDPFRIVQGSQGTIGIVTWATVKCETAPDEQRVLISGFDDPTKSLDFIYSVSKRKLVDDLLVLNSTNLSCALETNPTKIQKTRTTLPGWILLLSVSGHGILAADELEYRLADTLDVAKETGVELKKQIGSITAARVGALLGSAGEEPYWKLRLRGACQEVFFLTTLDHIPGFCSIFEQTAKDEAFPTSDIGVYIQPTLQGTNAHCGFDIYYDPVDKMRVGLAQRFYVKGCERLLEKGAFFSRPCGPVTEAVYKKTPPETVTAMKKVKAIFDPKHVLNPGALCFEEVAK